MNTPTASRKTAPLTHLNQMEIRCERLIRHQLSEEDLEKIINLILSNPKYTERTITNFHVDNGLVLRAMRCHSAQTGGSTFVANIIYALEIFNSMGLSAVDQAKIRINNIWESLSTIIFDRTLYPVFIKTLRDAYATYNEYSSHQKSNEPKMMYIFSVPLDLSTQNAQAASLFSQLIRLLQQTLIALHPKKDSVEGRKVMISHLLSLWPKDLPLHNVLQSFTFGSSNLLNNILSIKEDSKNFNGDNVNGDVLTSQINILVHVLEICSKKALFFCNGGGGLIQEHPTEITESEVRLIAPYLATVFKIDIDIFEIGTNQADNPATLGFHLQPHATFKPMILLTEENKSTYQVYQRSGQKVVMIYHQFLNLYYLVIPIHNEDEIQGMEHVLTKFTVRQRTLPLLPDDSLRRRMVDCAIVRHLHWYDCTELYWSCSPKWLKKTLLSHGAGMNLNQKQLQIPKKVIDEICAHRRSNLSLRSIIDNPNHLTNVGFYINKTRSQYAFVGNFKFTKQVDLASCLPVTKNTFLFEFDIGKLEKALSSINQSQFQTLIGHVGSQIISHSCLEKTKPSYPWLPPLADGRKSSIQPLDLSVYLQRFYTRVLYVKYSTGIVKPISVQLPNAMEDIHFYIPHYLAFGRKTGFVPETLVLVFFINREMKWEIMQTVRMLGTMIG
jgi:hypothetical protein